MPEDSGGPTTQLYSPLTEDVSWRCDTNCRAHTQGGIRGAVGGEEWGIGWGQAPEGDGSKVHEAAGEAAADR